MTRSTMPLSGMMRSVLGALDLLSSRHPDLGASGARECGQTELQQWAESPFRYMVAPAACPDVPRARICKCRVPACSFLGSGLVLDYSQNMTVAASATAEKKVCGQRSYRVATRRQSLSRPNMISMRLRLL